MLGANPLLNLGLPADEPKQRRRAILTTVFFGCSWIEYELAVEVRRHEMEYRIGEIRQGMWQHALPEQDEFPLPRDHDNFSLTKPTTLVVNGRRPGYQA
jgi:hypothetical protein